MLGENDRKYLQQVKQQIVFGCNVCHGSGVDCPCQELYAMEIRKAQAEIPIKYRNFTLETINSPVARPARDKVEKYIHSLAEKRKTGDGLFLWSESKGTAKTAFGCILLLQALEKGYSTYFTTLGKCVDRTAEGWYDDVKKEEFKQHILETDFLLIDDIGGGEIKTRGNRELTETTFTTLFRDRCNALLPTIMTSNLHPQDLQSDYGERLFSIACEHLSTIECAGPDFRREVIAKQKRERANE